MLTRDEMVRNLDEGFHVLVTACSDETLDAIHARLPEFGEAFIQMLIRLMPPAHETIRIVFELGDGDDRRRYEAVGFLRVKEDSCSGDEMFKRTADTNGGAVGEDDYQFIRTRLNELPTKLGRFCLVTNRQMPSDPRRVSCFDQGSPNTWRERRPSLDLEWGNFALVVRRLP